ncbi:Forkhead box protein I1 [Mycena sanguinolenta]|uniref:Forkhead box protein I1 n=1 Tax=Mycena sanguinolenta TaxID=230812 RepID=A0A8H7DGM4_9AGAR|nr:Forkhead box protein I1 [Mycena sanguinolenta]
MSSAPAMQRRKTATAARPGNKNTKRKKLQPSKAPIAAPSTPPRDNSRRKIHFSPSLYSSPSAKLAQHKVAFGASSYFDPSDVFRTPARKRSAASSSAHPITPKRLLFGIDSSSSPFRTPGGGTLSASPFRTPGGSRGGGIFDPHDPSALLNEELNNFGAVGRDSPAGLYGKGTLYDSPNPLDGSPGKWARWW